ncbi:MAG: hypothetical protein ACREJB_18670 [Planctomycetaceae bacterium]
MTLNPSLTATLKTLRGRSGAGSATMSGPDGVELTIDFTAVDSMSCSFREIRLGAPALANAGLDALKAWADALCRRVTYLLENVGPLEVDPEAQQVLVRSTPPDRQSGATTYYEMVLEARSDGSFSLRRYRIDKGTTGREPVDVQVTHEVLHRLTADLLDTMPT